MNGKVFTVKNKTLSLALAIIMIFGVLRVSALAVDEASENAVAEVTVDGTATYYTDIDAAFKAAEKAAGATIRLLADVVEINNNNGAGVELMSGDTTLDLNGKTLKQAAEAKWAGSGITVSVGSSSYSGTVGKLTICDSVGGGKIQQINTIPAVSAWGKGTLIIEGGTIEAPDSGEWPDSGQNMYLNSAVNIDDTATVIINGGTLKGVRGVLEDVSDGGSLTITGGSISGTGGNALIVCSGKATLFGGTFSTDSNDHSIWANNGKAADLLAENYQYIAGDGTESKYSADGKGVVGDTVVKNPNDKSVNYINRKGELSTQADYTEITAETWDISQGWYVVRENVTVSGLNISEEANLILCDGATLTVTEYLNVTENSTLNLYWQSGRSGKLTAKAVSQDSVITAPAGEMKKTADASGTTFEKCLTHEWEYAVNGDDTHTATCKLCKKVEAAKSHKYENWTSADEKTHTATCVCGAVSTVDHEFVYHLSADKKSHYGVCGVCNYTSPEKLHDADGTDGSCSVCGADADVAEEKAEVAITAPITGKVTTAKYTDLIEAFYDADISAAAKIEVRLLKSGKTYTLNSTKAFPIKFQYTHDVEVIVDLNGCTLKRSVTDNTYGILSVEEGKVTVKNGTLELDDSAAFNPASVIKIPSGDSPELTLTNMTVKATRGNAIYTQGGNLNIKSGTYGKVLINDNFATATLFGGSYDSVMCYNDYAELLETGYIFVNQSDNSYADPSSVGAYGAVDVKVIKCPHKDGDTSLFENGKCSRCAYLCEHTELKDGICTACGMPCPHTDVSKDGDDVLCTLCHSKIVIMATQENGDISHYSDIAVALEKTPDGSTLTLLDDIATQNKVCVKNTNGITLDLNGFTLSGTLRVGSLNDKGETVNGKLNVIDKKSGGAISLEVNDGGTLIFKPDNTLTKITKLSVYGGKTELYGGRLCEGTSSLELFNGITLLMLLPEGYAYTLYSGNEPIKILGYSDAKAGNVENIYDLVPEKCSHTEPSLDSSTNCPNCNAALVAVLTTADGKTRGFTDFAKDWNAFGKSGIVKLLCDTTLSKDTVFTNGVDCTLDLNGHSILSDGPGKIYVEKNGRLALTGRDPSDPYVISANWVHSDVHIGENGPGTLDILDDLTTMSNVYFSDIGKTELKHGKFAHIYMDENKDIFVSDLLADGYAFFSAAKILNLSSSRDVSAPSVEPHTHKTFENGRCTACGAKCRHTGGFTDDKCNACGYVCTHENIDESGKCAVCSKQISEPTVISVDITWDEMSFSYNEGQKTWDPENHVLSEKSGSWSGLEKTITVTNKSNRAIKAEFSFAGESGIKGEFLKSSVTVDAKTEETPAFDTTSFKITDGAIDKKQDLGTITVSVSAVLPSENKTDEKEGE